MPNLPAHVAGDEMVAAMDKAGVDRLNPPPNAVIRGVS